MTLYCSPSSGLSLARRPDGAAYVEELAHFQHSVAWLTMPRSTPGLLSPVMRHDVPDLGLMDSDLGIELAALFGPADGVMPGKYCDRDIFCFVFQDETFIAACEPGDYGTVWWVQTNDAVPKGQYAPMTPSLEAAWNNFVEVLMEARGQRLTDDQVLAVFGEHSAPYARRVAQALTDTLPTLAGARIPIPRPRI